MDQEIQEAIRDITWNGKQTKITFTFKNEIEKQNLRRKIKDALEEGDVDYQPNIDYQPNVDYQPKHDSFVILADTGVPIGTIFLKAQGITKEKKQE